MSNTHSLAETIVLQSCLSNKYFSKATLDYFDVLFLLLRRLININLHYITSQSGVISRELRRVNNENLPTNENYRKSSQHVKYTFYMVIHALNANFYQWNVMSVILQEATSLVMCCFTFVLTHLPFLLMFKEVVSDYTVAHDLWISAFTVYVKWSNYLNVTFFQNIFQDKTLIFAIVAIFMYLFEFSCITNKNKWAAGEGDDENFFSGRQL